MAKVYLSVIITAYNEEDNLARNVLTQVTDYLTKQKYTWELILVNDGSSDNTLAKLNKFAASNKNVRVIDNEHQGKAAGIITGALAAEGDYILFTDMDQATPMTEAVKLLQPLENKFDVVIGSRADRKGAPMFRQILAFGMVVLRTIILSLPFKDTQCGFKAFKKSAAQRIFTLMKSLRPMKIITGPAVDPGFDVEFLYLARKFGYKVSEVPVVWQYQESRRVRFLHDAISGITGLLIVRWRALLGLYR